MYTTKHFDLARNSLRFLVKEYNIKEMYIPYYLCDVMRHTLIEENCKPIFYHIDDYFMPDSTFSKESYILYPNYFGICERNTDILSEIYPKLIVDNAHSFYSQPKGFACFNAEHKFNPEKIGSYLWIKKMGEANTEEPAFPPPNNRRIDEFKKLHENFANLNNLRIELDYIKSPFCYPCLFSTDEQADKHAEKLSRAGKTIYRYWDSLPKTYNEYKFYRRLVPIPLTP